MKYIVMASILLFVSACTHKERIPMTPPKVEEKPKEVRTLAQMKDKLKSLRKPIAGVYLSKQKRTLSRDVDVLLRDTRDYNNRVQKFETLHKRPKRVIKKRKPIPKVMKVEEIEIPKESSDVSQLKYY